MNGKRKRFFPCGLATTIGSMPHRDVKRATLLMLEATPEIPSWVQLPKIRREENMIIQFTEGIPLLKQKNSALVIDDENDDFVDSQTRFYENYMDFMNGDQHCIEAFSISEKFASGLYEMVRHRDVLSSAIALKGQVTGPVTLGLNIIDSRGKYCYYNDSLRDMIVKAVKMKSIYQIEMLAAIHKPVIIFLDEPALLGIGSHLYITISKEDITRDINEVVDEIHARGAIAGIHCEENTDWGILMETRVDILDFDAYSHMQAITLYPELLHSFFEKGGWLGWGIVPTLDPADVEKENTESLYRQFEEKVDLLVEKGFDRLMLIERCLLTPSCGMGGGLNEKQAEKVLLMLRQLSLKVRQQYRYI